MAWIELEAKQDNFKVWNWNFSLINFLPSDKGQSWKGDLANLWELVQTLIANSIFLGQAGVKSQIESFFLFFFSFCLWILATVLLAWTTLCLLSGILEAGALMSATPAEKKGTNLLVFQPQKVNIFVQQYPYSRGPSDHEKPCPIHLGLKIARRIFFFLWAKTIKMVNKSRWPQMICLESDLSNPPCVQFTIFIIFLSPNLSRSSLRARNHGWSSYLFT